MKFPQDIKVSFTNHTRGIPGGMLQGNGYFRSNKDNLIDPSIFADIEKMYRQGDGNELYSKFQAVYSSAALVANHFGPFILNTKQLFIHIDSVLYSGFENVCLEKKFDIENKKGNAPNLDVLAEKSDTIIAIESKCTEIFRIINRNSQITIQ